MKLIAQIARILIGIEFIFSGFVKVVDPYGTGLKLQEYFEVFAEDLPAFKGFFEVLAHNSQGLSLVFCATELILGVALLFSFRMKITAWIVLLMISFFTFLTFYSAYFEKVTDCGCFGDFLKLEPWDSFLKDIISLTVILIIFFYRKKYKEFHFGKVAVGISAIISFGIGIYALRYLPPLDFLPYAKGLSISEQMEPTGIKPILEYKFLDKNLNEEIIAQEFLMDTTKYKYISVDVLNKDEVSPKITDFALTDKDGNTYTEEALQGAKLLIIIKKINSLEEQDLRSIKSLADASKNQIKPLVLTSVPFSDFDSFHSNVGLTYPYYAVDEKVLKTMARTNPTIMLLKDGTVMGKWSNHNIPTVKELLNSIN